ncbi:hypothetical protein LSH36_798g01028 [Paralvinella palmiformis]|uniref:Uncharacterized protein n=1 Tax=Paralvinella palmiformis TaxID=53620 RepID=A0AAD9MSA9_9ANNE|nr:hypothetical protein LSH36_798g01028 [Paralvinella palmiformis]
MTCSKTNSGVPSHGRWMERHTLRYATRRDPAECLVDPASVEETDPDAYQTSVDFLDMEKHRSRLLVSDPVPMRMRALPQSFWQQPNVPQNVSPAMAYPILPPLVNSKDEDQISDVRPITPPPEDKPDREKSKSLRCAERKITVANTDLLFKLFEGVEKDIRKNHPPSEKEHIKNRSHRTRKIIPTTTTNKALVSGEDPYLVDGVTEKLFPELRLEQTKGSAGVGPMAGTSLLHIVTLKEGDRSITLPSLSVEQNYPQMLSELVAHI